MRSYLDHELSFGEYQEVAAHLKQCEACQQRLNALREQALTVGSLLGTAGAVPDSSMAFERFQYTLHQPVAEPADVAESGGLGLHERTTIMKQIRPYRSALAGAAAVLLLVGLLFLPPVQALADQILQIFRVQNVVFVPVSSDRLEELENLDFDASTLFTSEPTMIHEPAEPYVVADKGAAENAVGYPLKQPTVFSTDPITTEMIVKDRAEFTFQVDVDKAQELLSLMEIDAQVPTELRGQDILVRVPASVKMLYANDEYTLTLFQGQSPDVQMPEGANLQEMARAAMLLLGVEPEQAAQLSQNMDWSSTLIVPFPSDIESMRQVTVGDTQGLLIEEQTESGHDLVLYWQDDAHFYVLAGSGFVRSAELITTAESLQ